MKKKSKILVTMLCLSLFAIMALGSGSSGSDDTKEIVATSNEPKTSVTIEEQELINQDGIVITAKEYVTDNIWGDGIKLVLENNTDKTVTVGCNALIVNNYMITDLFVAEVAPGKNPTK